MHAAKKAKKPKALQIAVLFFVIVGLLILLSLLVKAVLIVTRSHFDGQHQFVLQVDENKSTSMVVIFAPDTHTISLLTLSGVDAAHSALTTIGLPVDATMHSVIEGGSTSDIVGRVLSSSSDTLNILDRIKLFIFSKTVADEDIAAKSIQLPLPESLDTTVAQLTTDHTLYKEAMTVAIVNGSGISGLGNATAKLLTHIGANVISVTTADKEQRLSSISYTGEKTYTVSRLGKIFDIVPTVTTKAGIADVIVTIGQDKQAAL